MKEGETRGVMLPSDMEETAKIVEICLQNRVASVERLN